MNEQSIQNTISIAKLLIENGCDPSLQDKEGYSAAMRALEKVWWDNDGDGDCGDMCLFCVWMCMHTLLNVCLLWLFMCRIICAFLMYVLYVSLCLIILIYLYAVYVLIYFVWLYLYASVFAVCIHFVWLIMFKCFMCWFYAHECDYAYIHVICVSLYDYAFINVIYVFVCVVFWLCMFMYMWPIFFACLFAFLLLYTCLLCMVINYASLCVPLHGIYADA